MYYCHTLLSVLKNKLSGFTDPFDYILPVTLGSGIQLLVFHNFLLRLAGIKQLILCPEEMFWVEICFGPLKGN